MNFNYFQIAHMLFLEIETTDWNWLMLSLVSICRHVAFSYITLLLSCYSSRHIKAPKPWWIVADRIISWQGDAKHSPKIDMSSDVNAAFLR